MGASVIIQIDRPDRHRPKRDPPLHTGQKNTEFIFKPLSRDIQEKIQEFPAKCPEPGLRILKLRP